MTEDDSTFKNTIMFESAGLLTGIVFHIFGILTNDRTMEIIGTVSMIVFIWLMFYAVSVRITESENRQEGRCKMNPRYKHLKRKERWCAASLRHVKKSECASCYLKGICVEYLSNRDK